MVSYSPSAEVHSRSVCPVARSSVPRKGYWPARVAPPPSISTFVPSPVNRITGRPAAFGSVTAAPGSL